MESIEKLQQLENDITEYVKPDYEKNNKKLQIDATIRCHINCYKRDKSCAAYKHIGCKWHN
ncbi:MAG: hypothetical protein GY853_10085 [PVC group bacterium]|nr:hypothetical protein [PVC group bacterium]